MYYIVLSLTILRFTSATVNSSLTSISVTRNSNVATMCSQMLTVNQNDISTTNSYNAVYNQMMNNPNLAKILIQSQFDNSQINLQNSQNIIYFGIPHLICMAALLLTWPFLCCCCVSPQKYPQSQLCRKSDKQMYTRFQLKWTSYVLIVVSLVCVCSSLAGLLKGPAIIDNYTDLTCRIVTAMDNMQNGALSADGNTFWTGLSPLAAQLANFNSNSKLTTFYTQGNNSLNSNAQSIKSTGTNILSFVSNQYNSFTNTVYQNAFGVYSSTTGSPVYQNVTSQFQTISLGPATDSTKITGVISITLTNLFNQVNSALDPLLTSWAYLTTNITQSTFSTLLSTGVTELTNLSTNIDSTLNSIAKLIYNSNNLTALKSGLAALYGLMLVMSLIVFITATLISCFSVVRLRHILYCSCGILVVLGAVAFCALVFTLIFAPLTYQACGYIDTSLQTPQTTQKLFRNLGFVNFSDVISPCFGGDSNMINQIDVNLNLALNNTIVITTNTQNFNTLIGNYSTANLYAPYTSAFAMLNSVYTTQILDVADTVSLYHFNNVSSKTYSVDPTACISANVKADSWVPSFTAGNCSSGIAQMTPCSNLTNQTTCPFGCYEIGNEFGSASGDQSYTTNLASRYGSSCPYNLYIQALYTNWTTPRNLYLMSVNSSIINSSLNQAASYNTKVQTLQTNLATFSSTLSANFDSLTNTNYGALYGLSCQPIKESITNFRNSLCVGFYNSLNYNLICLAICSWTATFISFFATCTGVRHYKHLKKMESTLSYAGLPINLSESKIA